MAENKLNDQELDNVAGGFGNSQNQNYGGNANYGNGGNVHADQTEVNIGSFNTNNQNANNQADRHDITDRHDDTVNSTAKTDVDAW